MIFIEKFGKELRYTRYTCEKCGCIFYSDEGKIDFYDRKSIYTFCPCCERLVYISKEE